MHSGYKHSQEMTQKAGRCVPAETVSKQMKKLAGLMLQSSVLDCCGTPAEARSAALATSLHLALGFFPEEANTLERKGWYATPSQTEN